jgi:small subunit ribosomal protein S8
LSNGEASAAGEIFVAQIQPLQKLRSPARVYPAIPDLPDLFSGIGEPRQNPWRDKGELVMNITDPIADLLTRVRNANAAGKAETTMPTSRLKAEVAKVLKQNGYVADFYVEKQPKGPALLKIQLKTIGKDRAIVGIKRISRPGLRRYVHATEIPRVLGGMGISIVTTSRGVMTGHEAKKQNVGGEILAYVW